MIGCITKGIAERVMEGRAVALHADAPPVGRRHLKVGPETTQAGRDVDLRGHPRIRSPMVLGCSGEGVLEWAVIRRRIVRGHGAVVGAVQLRQSVAQNRVDSLHWTSGCRVSPIPPCRER